MSGAFLYWDYSQACVEFQGFNRVKHFIVGESLALLFNTNFLKDQLPEPQMAPPINSCVRSFKLTYRYPKLSDSRIREPISEFCIGEYENFGVVWTIRSSKFPVNQIAACCLEHSVQQYFQVSWYLVNAVTFHRPARYAKGTHFVQGAGIEITPSFCTNTFSGVFYWHSWLIWINKWMLIC